MIIKENKKRKILGSVSPKKAKLKGMNKIIVLKNEIVKKSKQFGDSETNGIETDFHLKASSKKNKKKHKQHLSNNVETEDEVIQIDDSVEVEESKSIKKQKKSKKKNVESENELIQIDDNIEVVEESKSIRKKKKSKRNKLDSENVLEVNDITENVEESSKKQKKGKKNKNQNKIELQIDVTEETNEPETSKKLKKVKKNKNDDDPNEEPLGNLKSENTIQKQKKQKKRKLSESDIIDSNDEAGEEIPLKKKKKKESEKPEPESTEAKERTVFVGNVPLKSTKTAIKKHFRKYGIIESIRIRGLPAANPKLSKKVVAIKQEFHPDRNNFICYIRYTNKEDALKAEAANGSLFEGHHLRVHCCLSEAKPDETKAIFIGNLSFDATEDELWKLFEDCGPISHVRIIRDTYTGMGKGFAYVNFKDSDAVQLALEMEDVKLKNRELRISLCNSSVAKKNKKLNKRKEITESGRPRFRKPFRRNLNGNAEGFEGEKGMDSGRPHFKKSFKRNNDSNFGGFKGRRDFANNKNKGDFIPQGKNTFQGSKFTDKKKKFKKDKGMAEKKKKINLIAPKTE